MKNINIKRFFLVLTGLGFLLSNTGYSWAVLPCLPDCIHEAPGSMGSHHNDNLAESSLPFSQINDVLVGDPDHEYAPEKSEQASPNNCDACMDIYKSMFSYLLTTEMESETITHEPAFEKFVIYLNNHIPEPYRSPPA